MTPRRHGRRSPQQRLDSRQQRVERVGGAAGPRLHVILHHFNTNSSIKAAQRELYYM